MKIAEKLYPIYAVRNHQALGSDRGRPDWEIGFKRYIPNVFTDSPYRIISETFIFHETVYIELKSPNWTGRLNEHQQKHKDRIERAGGQYHIITTIEELDEIFKARGFEKIQLDTRSGGVETRKNIRVGKRNPEEAVSTSK